MKSPEAQFAGGVAGENNMNAEELSLNDVVQDVKINKYISQKDIFRLINQWIEKSSIKCIDFPEEREGELREFQRNVLILVNTLQQFTCYEEGLQELSANILIGMLRKATELNNVFSKIILSDLVQRVPLVLSKINVNKMDMNNINVDEFVDALYKALNIELQRKSPFNYDSSSNYDVREPDNKDPFIYSNEYAFAAGFSLRANESADRLLKLLQSTKQDYKKQFLSKILHKLEFGKINISEEGVKYLEKMYDLGEMNNPDYFVNRLTGSGDIGIFDETQVLQGYFNIGDISSEESVVQSQVMEFTYETLFFSKKGETKEEKIEREKYLQEFKENYFDFYDDEFVKRTGIRFNNLGFKEQGQFLIYYKNASEEKKEELLDFVSKYGENGLRTFLSIEQGGSEMGEKILIIGENLKEKDAKKVFAKYEQLVDTVNNAGQYIVGQFNDESDVQISEITQKLLMKGRKLLELVADNIEMSDNVLERIIQKIDSIKIDIELFKTVAKTLHENGATLEQMKDATLITLHGEELRNNDKIIQKMKQMYAQNYKDYPKKFRDALIDSIDKKIEDSSVLFHIATHKDKQGNELMSFLTIKKQDDGNIYFGSFNTDNEMFGGASIGLSLAEQVFVQQEKDGADKIEAHSVPHEGINSVYVNRYHFVVDNIEENYEYTGVDLFHITRESKNKNYYFQNKLLNEELKKQIIKSIEQIDENTNHFIIKLTKDNIIQQTKQLLSRDFVLTKYDIDKDDGNIYCGFEKKITE